MSTAPRSLAWRSVSAQLAWPARASASTAARPSGPASGASPWSRVDPVGAERVERPVLEEDVHRLAERRGAGGEDRGGLQLVVRAGEEDQVEGFVHGGHLVGPAASAGVGLWVVAGVADSAASRRSRRSRTARMIPQAIITSGSDSR